MITKELLNDLFNYCAITGNLIWRRPTAPRVRAGDAVLSLNSNGYVQCGLFGKKYLVHRLIWVMHFGSIPDSLVIDHIDCIKTNNRLENLRLASVRENTQNSKGKVRSTSAFKGVRFESSEKRRRSKPWTAQICVDGIPFRLGAFSAETEAAEAYMKASTEAFGEFHHNTTAEI